MISRKLILLLTLSPGFWMRAQSGPCTPHVVEQGHLEMASDAFAYMPPYGGPAVGKSEIEAANTKSFPDETNITTIWGDDHRIAAAPSGEMAYEYGTVHITSDSKSKGHQEFKAVVLIVYGANGGACQKKALTMQPIQESAKH